MSYIRNCSGKINIIIIPIYFVLVVSKQISPVNLPFTEIGKSSVIEYYILQNSSL
jgi:hypothetical protein